MRGVAFCKLGDYVKAKLEFEEGVMTAPAGYIRQTQIWGRLRHACVSLGLRTEAQYYAELDRAISKPS